MPLYLSHTIRSKSIDGLVIILDLKGGGYHLLDKVASAMWQACIEDLNDQAALLKLMAAFDVNAAQVGSDFETFRQSCLEKGFLTSVPAEPRATRRTPRRVLFATWHAWACIVYTVVLLRWRGFGVTYARYAGLDETDDAGAGGADATLRQALRAFWMAENFAPLKCAPQDCLPRSLALFRFLRDMRLPVEHCIGVARYPFHSHAWVEYRSEVLADADRRGEFTTLARIAA